MTINLLPDYIKKSYEVHEWKHACTILHGDFNDEWNDLCSVLKEFRLYRSHMMAPGGGKSKVAQSIDYAFQNRGWKEKNFHTQIIVDESKIESPTHKVDCVKNRVAIEIEWSNKDPFFDRDLNNFRLLFELRAISVGIIITKSDQLREIMESLGIWKKYGTSTTWMGKLLPRIEGGGGGGCPIIVFGIKKELYIKD